ncbi:efflux transporter outer membrane subunit [Pacificimonas sp. ICDLI1SI03]
MTRAAISSLIIGTLTLGGCAVGPRYEAPDLPPPAAEAFVENSVGTTRDAAAEDWWRLYDDPVLDRLVQEALQHNTDLRVALANVAEARAALSEAANGRLPTTEVNSSYNRRRIAGGAGALGAGGGAVGGGGVGGGQLGGGGEAFELDLFSLGFDASYEVDLFGRVSATIDAARANRDAAIAAFEAAQVMVTADTTLAYARLCGAAVQQDAARETAELQQRTLDLTQRLVTGGRGTRADTDRARVLLEQARAQIPAFEGERRASLYALSALTGRTPQEADRAAAACRSLPDLTTPIPVGDGAALLARRPDVRQAERALASTAAQVGIVTADLYPRISLLGSASLVSTTVDGLGDDDAFGFSLGPLISWSFPNMGAVRARIRQADARADAALADFDGTVLTALTETEQALARYSASLERRDRLADAAAAGERAAELTRLRYDAGADSLFLLVDAERTAAEVRAQLAAAKGDVVEAQVALFRALGGGWQNAGTPVQRDISADANP